MEIDKIYRLSKNASMETESNQAGRKAIIRHKGFEEWIPLNESEIAALKVALDQEFPDL